MPATSSEPKFNCATCGKEYRWKSELAGKKAKCKCGNVIAVPARAPAAAPAATRAAVKPARQDDDLDGLYALAQEEKKGAAAASGDESSGYRCPSCSASIPAGAVICAHCGLDMRTGTRQVATAGGGVLAAAGAYAAATPSARAGVLAYGGGRAEGARRVDEDIMFEGGRARSLYLPIGLIALGILFYFGQVAFSSNKLSAGVMVGMVMARVVLDSLLILVAMLIAVRAFDMGFGAFGPAVLKILAIALGPGALGQMVEAMLGGQIMAILIGVTVAVVLYFTLIKVLFNLDLGETFLLVVLIIAVRRVLGTLLFVMLIGMASSGLVSKEGAGAVGVGTVAVASAGDDGEKIPPKRMLDPEEIAHDLDKGWLSSHNYNHGGTDPAAYLDAHPEHVLADMTKERSAAVVKQLTDLGAKDVVFIDVQDVTAKDGGRMSNARGVEFELPEDKEARRKIFAYRADLLKSVGQQEVMVQVEVGGRDEEPKKQEALKDWGQKYMVIHFGYGNKAAWSMHNRRSRTEEPAEQEGDDAGGDSAAKTPPADAPTKPPAASDTAAPAPAAPGGAAPEKPKDAGADAPF